MYVMCDVCVLGDPGSPGSSSRRLLGPRSVVEAAVS